MREKGTIASYKLFSGRLWICGGPAALACLVWGLCALPVYGQARVHRLGTYDPEEVLPPAPPRLRSNNGEIRDAGQAYLDAYRLCRDAEVLAEKGSYNAALRKGQLAERLFAALVRDFPQWKTNLVSTRRHLLSENMQTWRQKAKEALPTERRERRGTVTNELPPIRNPEGGSTYHPIELPNYETTDRKLYNALARAQDECSRMARAYADLNALYTEVQKKLIAAQNDRAMYKERYEKLREQVTSERAAGNSVVSSLSNQLAEMESKYRNSQAALKEAEKRAGNLQIELNAAIQDLERVTRERDALSQENEKLRAVVELNSPEKTKALLDQNLTLAEQLKTAQEKIAELEAMQTGASDQNEVLSKQLDEARAEAARLREELNSIYDENMGYRRRVSELTEQLNNMEADLAAREKEPPTDPALLEETKLLREMIEKQRKTIAMQEESRRLLIETFRKQNSDDPNVVEALKRLEEESSPGLTENEQKLLKDLQDKAAKASAEAAQKAETEKLNLQIRSLAELADKAFTRHRYLSAEQMYLTLYDLKPDNLPCLVNLGTILLYNNKSTEAFDYLTRATRLAPDMAIGHYLAGIACYRLEKLDEARRLFARAVQLDPGNAEAFFYLANIEGIGAAYDQALKHYAAAVKINPELSDAHYNMARLYAEIGRVPEAARSYDRAINGGSVPDPEFEKFLRAHPDTVKRPGSDLVKTVKPEEEAKLLREEGDGQETSPASQVASSSDASPDPPPDSADSFAKKVEEISVPIADAEPPSPAGSVDAGSPSLTFRDIRMRTSSGRRNLRVRQLPPHRFRDRKPGTPEPKKDDTAAPQEEISMHPAEGSTPRAH